MSRRGAAGDEAISLTDTDYFASLAFLGSATKIVFQVGDGESTVSRKLHTSKTIGRL